MPSIFFWKRKRKRGGNKNNTTSGDGGVTTRPTPTDTTTDGANLTDQATSTARQPKVEASYDVLTKPPSEDGGSDDTEPGYSVVAHNKTITSPNSKPANQHSSTDHDKPHTPPLQSDPHSTLDVDPEELYSKVVSKKHRQKQLPVTQSQSEYDVLQHRRTSADDVIPWSSPQLYSIMDMPHRTVSPLTTANLTNHDLTASAAEQLYSSSENGYTSGDDIRDQRRSHHMQKSFQPIAYLPPRPSLERRHKRIKSRHHHSDSDMTRRSHSTPSDHLKKNEFLVRGTSLDGSVTLYAAAPVGSPVPIEQAGPVLTKLSSPNQAHVIQQLSPSLPTHQSPRQPLGCPVVNSAMMSPSQQQFTSSAVSHGQPVSTTAALIASIDPSDQHRGHQTLISSLPITTSSVHGQIITPPVYTTVDLSSQNQNANYNRSMTSEGQHASGSLYRDMLELMQKREAELIVQVDSVNADKERLQADNAVLQQNREAIPLLHSQISSLQVENQMLQLTVEKLNEELSGQHQSLTASVSNESEVSDLTDTDNEDQPVKSDEVTTPAFDSVTAQLPNKQHSLPADTHDIGLSDNNSYYSKEACRSPLGENTILMKELQRQQELIKEMQQDHKSELSKMSRKLQRAYHDRDSLITRLADMDKKQTHLQERLSVANETISHQIPLHDHQQSMKELQVMLDELMATHEAVTTAQADKLRSLKKEKKCLSRKLSDAKSIIVQLESQCAGLHKTNRKLKEELDQMQESVELSRDREHFVHGELSKAVLQVEKTTVERDTLAHLVSSHQKATERAEHRRKNKSTSKHLKKLHAQPSTGEVIADDDIDYAYSTDQELARQQEHCQRAIDHIRSLEKSKQEELLKTTVTGSSNKGRERHLDKLWKAAVTPK